MRYQSPIAQALSDSMMGIAGTFASQPTPADREKQRLENEYLQSQIGVNTQKVRAGDLKTGAAGKLADVVRNALTPQQTPRPQPDFVGPMPQMSRDDALQQALPDMVRYGMEGDIAGQLPDLNRMLTASGGGSDAATDRAMLGAGSAFSSTKGGFDADQRRMVQDNELDNTTTRRGQDLTHSASIYNTDQTQAGLNNRFTVNTSPGAITTLAPGNPLGTTRIEGNPTPETVKGDIASNFLAEGGDINQTLKGNTPLGESFGASAEGSGAAPSRLGKLIAERDALPPDSLDRPLYDEAIKKENALRAGVSQSPKNYTTPEGKRGVTYDGLTDASTKAALPQGTQLSGSKAGSYTEQQTKDGAFAIRMDGALTNLAKLPENFDVAKAGDFLLQDAKIPWTNLTVGNKLIPKERQLYNQAAREILAIFLRKDSGAAVTEQEITFYGGTYLPMPWDEPETVQQKLGAINRMKASLIVGSNGSYDDAKRMLEDPNFATDVPFAGGTGSDGAPDDELGFDPNQEPEDTKVVNGVYYEMHNGQWFEAVDE